MEQEASKVTIEIMERAAELALEREGAVKEAKSKDVEKKRAEKKKLKKKPWGWLKMEARKVLIEMVREIERVGRVKLGERKKRELLKKLNNRKERVEEPTLPPAQPPEGATDDNVMPNQLLIVNLVRGDREGSGKRKRGCRRGLWLSWEGNRGLRPDPVRAGRRMRTDKVEDMEYTANSSEGMELLHVQKNNEQPGCLAWDHHGDMNSMNPIEEQGLVSRLLGLNLEEQEHEIPKMRDCDNAMPAWELEELLWLTIVALDNQNRTLLDRFQEINNMTYKQFHFGEEIDAHQFVERAAKSCNSQENPTYILDNFDLTLRSSNQCNILTGGCCCGQVAGGHGDGGDATQDNILSPASSQLPTPMYPASTQENMMVSPVSKQLPQSLFHPMGQVPQLVQSHQAQPQLADTLTDSEATSVSDVVNENGASTEQTENNDNRTSSEASSTSDIVRGSKILEPGIAAKVRIFENTENDVVMNKEMRKETKEPRSVVIKRKCRNGQRREDGVKVIRIDDLFKSSTGSQMDEITLQRNKRKLNDEEKPSENKRSRKFGQ